MRILVLGGRGCIGRRVVTACRKLDGAQVVVGGRKGDCTIDLRDSATHKAMAGFDYVVNCTDSLALPPQRAALYCLHSGSTFLEPSADATVVEGMWRELGDDADPIGLVVLGAGLFPGLSNLLARRLFDSREGTQRLEIGVRYSPFSQAGAGICNLMAHVVGRRSLRYEKGERWQQLPVRVGGRLVFSGVDRGTLGVGLPEALMLHWSTGVPSTGAYLTPIPSFPIAVQRLIIAFTPWGLMRYSPFRAIARGGLWFVRRLLFGWLGSKVELCAAADRTADEAGAQISMRVSDGMKAVGYSIAATIAVLAARKERPAGVKLIDDVVGLEDVTDRMRELAGSELQVEGP